MDPSSSPASSIDRSVIAPSSTAASAGSDFDERGDPPWLHLAVGLAQGLGIQVLWTGWCEGCALDAPTLVRAALLYAALVAPLVWHFTSGGIRSPLRRAVAALATGLLFGAMAAWTYGRADPVSGWWFSPLAMAWFNLPLIVLVAVAVSLLIRFDATRRRPERGVPIDFVGRNVVLLVAAIVLTGALWVLLGASGLLMLAIGVKGWLRTLSEFSFIAPVTCGAFGLAIGSMLRRPRAMEAVRATVMQSIGWLLPLALAFLAVWAAALPLTGFAVLHRTRSAASYLLWFGALCIVFANAWTRGHGHGSGAAGDGRPWLRSILGRAWPLTNLLPALAGWALYLRIQQYGLTPERVWAVVVCVVVAVCTWGYSRHSLKPSAWLSNLPTTNAVAAVLLAVTLASLITPLVDARRLSVLNQVARLRAGDVKPDAFDWPFLRDRADHYGREALQGLAALPQATSHDAALAARATQELAAMAKAGSAAAPVSRPGRRVGSGAS